MSVGLVSTSAVVVGLGAASTGASAARVVAVASSTIVAAFVVGSPAAGPEGVLSLATGTLQDKF